MTFSERLQSLIDSEKISQVELANAVNVPEARVSVWISGNTKKPQRKKLQLLAEHFNCDINWLAEGKGEPFPDRYTPPAGDAINLTFEKKAQEKNSPTQKILEESESLDTLRQYRDLAQMDADTLGEIQTWINDMERMRPGYTAWFRLEFQNRFPEFDEWKGKVIKKQANGDNY